MQVTSDDDYGDARGIELSAVIEMYSDDETVDKAERGRRKRANSLTKAKTKKKTKTKKKKKPFFDLDDDDSNNTTVTDDADYIDDDDGHYEDYDYENENDDETRLTFNADVDDEEEDDDNVLAVNDGSLMWRSFSASWSEKRKLKALVAQLESLRNMWKLDIFENTGSTARDMLANERTFLAWFRTALATSGLGVALAKLSLFTSAEWAGLVFVLLGAIQLVYCTYRYFQVLNLLSSGKFAPDKVGIMVLVVVAFVTIFVALLVTIF
jgi:inner membrane protein YidH